MRFPGFEDKWEIKKLQDVVKINQGLQIMISERLIEAEDGAHFYITNEFLKKSSEKKYYIKNPPSSVLCTEEDILMTRTGNTGMVVTNVSGAFHNNFFKVAYPETIVKGFLYNFLKLPDTQKQIIRLAGTSTIPDLNHSDFYNIKITFPKKTEQSKIASFVAVIDERIQTQNKIIEGLKLSKKILIKKIFNQQLSFDGRHNNNFPDWEEKKIKELFSFKITNSFSREQLNHKNGKVKNIHYGDIHTRFQTLFDIEKEEVPYINTDVNINKINEENYCAIGDMVFADASEDLIDVGKSIEIVNLNNQKLLAGLHTILARPISNTFSIGFCGYLFKSDRIRTQIQKESQGSKVLSISAVRLSNISFSIPCIEEQIKITDFLSSIDSKIDIETRFLQKLELQKKFLLQNLFV